ncbi:MAG: triose-phosphate isomerase [Candidatus Magasanikbacteria bacterium]|nr:triose-phosphate isomerase [Candidatus Magasanikbacteria bacterium]
MTDSKKIYLLANWKMYLDLAESVALATALRAQKLSPEIVMTVFPSALALSGVVNEFSDSDIAVGAQNTYFVDKGGLTGEISAAMFAAAGCQYALVGHSERRHLFGESNHLARQKIEAILATNLVPVLCVGETKEQRDSGEAAEVLEAQIRSAFTDLTCGQGRQFIVAYEPVWAVGTGAACDPFEAERMAGLIETWGRLLLGENSEVFVVYGGSVRPDNVAAYLKEPHVSGVLVGAASSRLDTWLEIVQSALTSV